MAAAVLLKKNKKIGGLRGTKIAVMAISNGTYLGIIILLKLQLFFFHTQYIHTHIYENEKGKEVNLIKKKSTILMGKIASKWTDCPYTGASDSLKYGNPPQISVKSLMGST